jgi:hypothetical protein
MGPVLFRSPLLAGRETSLRTIVEKEEEDMVRSQEGEEREKRDLEEEEIEKKDLEEEEGKDDRRVDGTLPTKDLRVGADGRMRYVYRF